MTEEMASVEKYCNQREKNTTASKYLVRKLDRKKNWMEWNQRAFVTIAKPFCAKGVDRNAKECQIKMKTLKTEGTSKPLFAYNQAVHPYKSNAANSCCFVRIRLRTDRAGAVRKSNVHQLIIWAAPSVKLRIEGTLTEAAASWRFLPVIDFPHPHLPAGAGFDSATLHSQVCWIVKEKKMTQIPLAVTCCAALPFRAPVVVVALDGCCGFLEADVVESSKGRAADVFDCVVGDEELLLRWGGDGEGSSEGELLQNKARLNLGSTLPSTSWKYSPSSSDPHSRNHPSWTTLHTGRRPETCPWHKK